MCVNVPRTARASMSVTEVKLQREHQDQVVPKTKLIGFKVKNDRFFQLLIQTYHIINKAYNDDKNSIPVVLNMYIQYVSNKCTICLQIVACFEKM